MDKINLKIPIVVLGTIGHSFYKQAVEMTTKIEQLKAELKACTNSQETVDRVHDKIKHISTTTRASYLAIVLPLFQRCIDEVKEGKQISLLQLP